MSSLLAGLLSIGIIGVILNALSEIGLANVEGNCLNVLADIGGLAIAADTVELEGFLCIVSYPLIIAIISELDQSISNIQDRKCFALCQCCKSLGRHCAGRYTRSLRKKEKE